MYLVSVIPISSSAHTDSLDYFSKEAITPGMIVAVPLRKKVIHALVIALVSLTEAKHMVKRSDFAMRKVQSVIGPSPISSTTLAGLRAAAQYAATSVGVVIAHTVATEYLGHPSLGTVPRLPGTTPTVLVLQDTLASRIAYYKQQLAKGERLLILTPTDVNARTIAGHFKNEVSLVHIPQKLTTKKRTTLIQALRDQPQVVIGTAQALGYIDQVQPTCVVIEHESDNRYIRQRKPHLDMRMVAEMLARTHGIGILFADTLVRSYTHTRITLDQMTYVYPPVFPDLSLVTMVPYVTDRVQEKDSQTVRNPFFTPELVTLLQKEHQHLIVFVPRKGIAPSVVCQDCGTMVTCDVCGLPHKLIHKKDAQGNRVHYYVCKYKEHMIPAYNTCRHCTGHRLMGLGITTQRIQEELVTLLPSSTVLVFDQDETPTEKKQRAVIDAVHTDPDTVLVATSLVIPYLDASVHTILIPSFDMLLSQPNPEAVESIVRTLAIFAETTSARIILQTRLPDHPLWEHCTKRTLDVWMRNDIQLRTQYLVPPLSTALVVCADLTLGTTAVFQNTIQALGIQPESVTVTQGARKHQLVGTAVFRLPTSVWSMEHQDMRLAALLQLLPPHYHVELRTDV